MRVTGSRVYTRPAPVPKMPPGLEMLMEGLTRQVLKNNPDDIYEYCANHMLKLLEIRDGRGKCLFFKQPNENTQCELNINIYSEKSYFDIERQNFEGSGTNSSKNKRALGAL